MEAQILGELVARRRQIVEMFGMEQNRRGRVGDKRLVKKIDRHAAFLEKELGDVDFDIDAGVRSSPLWREAEELLVSVPGVGPVTARTLIAELPEIDFSKIWKYESTDLTTAAQELACLAGGCEVDQ